MNFCEKGGVCRAAINYASKAGILLPRPSEGRGPGWARGIDMVDIEGIDMVDTFTSLAFEATRFGGEKEAGAVA